MLSGALRYACGAASFGNLYAPISSEDAERTLNKIWDLGYSYFDTAPLYGFGLSERRIGDFLRKKKKESYTLSTKVGRLLLPDGSYNPDRDYFIDALPFRVKYDYSYDGIMRSFEDSLQRLGLEKIDILYMHDIGKVTHGEAHPEIMKTAMSGGYKALEELKRSKLIQGFGIGVNEYEVCEEAMEYGDWDYFLLAGRYTLLEQDAIRTFIPKCEKRGSKIVLGGIYNSGILATGAVKGAMYNYTPAPKEILDKVRAIEAICQKHHTSLIQAALQFPTLNKNIDSILIGGSKAKHFEAAIRDSEVEIPEALWKELADKHLILEECLSF